MPVHVQISCSCHDILVLCVSFIALLAAAVVISLKGSRNWKKFFSAVLLLLAIVPLQVMGAAKPMADGAKCFLVTSTLLLVMAVVLIMIVEHQREGAPEAEERGGKGKPLERLLDFIRLFLSRFFVGEMLTSIYGLFLFVLFAMTLTAWLPAGMQYAQPVFTLATVIYVIDIILLSAWVYGPLTGRKKDTKPTGVKYLIYALSSPVGRNQNINWDVNRIKTADCADLRRDNVSINIVPLYVSLHRHFGKLEKLFLLHSNVHLGNRKETENGLRAFFEKASECLRKDHGECVSFRVHWEEIFSGGSTETIPPAGCERTIEVHFVDIGSANDVMEVYHTLRKNRRLAELLEKHRREVLFHVTGGTAVVSAAMVLHALKRDVRAEYLRQDATGKEPWESLREIDIDLFEDLGDIVQELREYFEGE